jgi:hypothetical protein
MVHHRGCLCLLAIFLHPCLCVRDVWCVWARERHESGDEIVIQVDRCSATTTMAWCAAASIPSPRGRAPTGLALVRNRPV